MRTLWNVSRHASAAVLALGLMASVPPSPAQAATLTAAPALRAADVDVVSIIVSVFALVGDILRFVGAIVNAIV